MSTTQRGTPPLAEADPSADERWGFARGDFGESGLDDRTWADLDLDAVMRHIDRAHTTLGRQMLYLRLRLGVRAPGRDQLSAQWQAFGADSALHDRVRRAFKSLNPIAGQQFWRIAKAGAIPRRGWYAVFPVLTMVTITLVVATFWYPKLIFALACALLLNALLHAISAAPMIAYRSAFSQIAPVIRMAYRLNAMPNVRRESIGNDLDALRPLFRAARMMGGDAHEVGELVAAAREYLNLLLLIDANALLIGARALERSHESLARVAEWVGDVDLAAMIHTLRTEGRTWCTPARDGTARIEIVLGWHPLIAAPVPASIRLEPGVGLIVTGSNMSGKSTFLRMAGVCLVMADALDLCPAERLQAPPISVHTCIGRADNLLAGRSYYLAEVERVLELLDRSAAPGVHLFLFDELFRGTNTVERLAAGEAILRAMQRRDGPATNHVVVATHDGELVTMLSGAYRPIHFEEAITPGGITFDYVVRDGPATSRTAIKLLELSGAPDDVLRAARARADELGMKRP